MLLQEYVLTSTNSESTIVGNTPTSSSTATSNPKGPCEAVIVCFDKAVDTWSLLQSRTF